MLFDFDEGTAAEESRSLEPDGEAETHAAAAQPARSDTWFHGLIGLLVGIALALVAVIVWPERGDEMSQGDIDTAVEAALSDRADEPAPGTQVFNQIAPSLVVVRAIADEDGSDSTATANIGSGVVINDQGQILTANHVVEDAASIELILSDGTRVPAQMVTNEPDRDIAVLETTGPSGPLTPAILGNSRTLKVGDPIYAIGNPLGLTGSISAGVISGLSRSVPLPDDDRVLDDLIQFDAAVNQGSSGGPLLNDQGHVIGIVTALADPSQQGYFIGIGLAVPIDIAAGGAADGPAQ